MYDGGFDVWLIGAEPPTRLGLLPVLVDFDGEAFSGADPAGAAASMLGRRSVEISAVDGIALHVWALHHNHIDKLSDMSRRDRWKARAGGVLRKYGVEVPEDTPAR